MKFPGKCTHCGASSDETFEVPEPKAPPVKGENLLVAGVVTLLLGLLALAFSTWEFYHWNQDDDERMETLTERFKDDCWVAKVQKDLGLPRATNAELWCEAHGHCGPARESLAAMLDDCDKELEKIRPQYHDALRQAVAAKAATKVARKEEQEALDDEHEAVLLLEAYVEASVDSLCSEEVQEAWEWAQDWESRYFRCAQDSHKDYVKIEYAEEQLGRSIDLKSALAWWEADE